MNIDENVQKNECSCNTEMVRNDGDVGDGEKKNCFRTS